MLLDHIDYEKLLVPLNKLYDLHTGGSRRPVFHDIATTRPELLELDRNFHAIREELLGILPAKRLLPRYHELDQMQTYISATVDRDKDWKIYPLNIVGIKPPAMCARCPRTMTLLERIPSVFQAFFSILEGGKSIPPHNGPYRGYLRYHLALIVPDVDPPSIRLKDQFYTWKEGESILFDDSWNHEVINKSPGDRVVLIVDIRRPLPLPLDVVNRMAHGVMKAVYGRPVARKLAAMAPPEPAPGDRPMPARA
jgi:aspartyl/asparaginyl beta-hydroxylase (cupin superfamily)